MRQTVRIIEMDHPQGVLRTGDRATVRFEFISHPEFIKEGMKLLFREGKTKVLMLHAVYLAATYDLNRVWALSQNCCNICIWLIIELSRFSIFRQGRA